LSLVCLNQSPSGVFLDREEKIKWKSSDLGYDDCAATDPKKKSRPS
jgi:hypothetical protein